MMKEKRPATLLARVGLLALRAVGLVRVPAAA